MELTQDILLPVLLAAIVANTVILLLVVVASRMGRNDRVTPATTRSVLQGSLLSSSFVDQSARSSWRSDGESNGAAPGARDEAVAADSPADAETGGDADGDRAAQRAGDAAHADDASTEPPGLEPVAGAETAPAPTAPHVPEPTGIDLLTGLLDQAAFTRLIVAEDARIHRYHRPATVVIVELGGLDRLIDRLGPDAADRIIPALADTMRRLARDVDHVARLAPGRFGVILPETDEVAAINYVERIRRACELWLESGAIALTLAAGWAGTAGDPTLVESLRLATDRMYVELRRDARRADRSSG